MIFALRILLRLSCRRRKQSVAVGKQNCHHGKQGAYHQKTVGNVEYRRKNGKRNEISDLSAEKFSRIRLHKRSVDGVAYCASDNKGKTHLSANAACAAAPQHEAKHRRSQHGDDKEHNICGVAFAHAKGCPLVVHCVKPQKFAQHVYAFAWGGMQQIFKYELFCQLIQSNAHGNYCEVHRNKNAFGQCFAFFVFHLFTVFCLSAKFTSKMFAPQDYFLNVKISSALSLPLSLPSSKEKMSLASGVENILRLFTPPSDMMDFFCNLR